MSLYSIEGLDALLLGRWRERATYSLSNVVQN